MSELVGHQRQLGWLTRELPQVTLITGPASVGKRKLAHEILAARGGVSTEVTELTADEARRVTREAGIAPFGPRKNILIRLDKSSETAQNILLKTLEEPAPTARFLLLASEPLLPTIVSRCHRIRVGLLTDDEVFLVLTGLGVSEADARAYAPWGNGQVAPALEAVSGAERLRAERGLVSAALKAALSPEAGLLSTVMRGWGREHTVHLTAWAAEASHGRWRRFGPAVAPGVTQAQARRLLVALSRYSGTHTAAAVALDEAFSTAD